MDKLSVVIFCGCSFWFGIIVGYSERADENNLVEKEIIELSIELTKLKIEELKRNESNQS